ncbi:hypothetical protein [Vallitalea okinawensis]|uniref:hypothetical protein n=1 Tax=Vallitalea okinawensis TaxID=2078660 RepID=UPI000CFA8F97|nr:hypothetical protein [Vallitalea okinawensis]
MKRFLLLSTLMFFLMLGYSAGLVSKPGTYDKITYFTKTEGKELFIYKDNSWQTIKLTGINMNPGKPGAFPGDSLVTEEEYLRWFSYIKDMSMNCVRVQNIMPEEFYEALEEFNRNREEPLYLLQGIYFDEVYLKDGYDPQSRPMNKIFKDTIKSAVNIIHGNTNNYVNINLFETYTTDISKYVIGYTIGIHWATQDIIYSEMMNDDVPYKGEYFYTNEEATSFESYLAESADFLVDYETTTYGEQRLVSIIGSPSYHLNNGNMYTNGSKTVLLDKESDTIAKGYIDVENIKTTNRLNSGIFVSYNIYPTFSQLVEYEENEGMYFSKVNNYHSIPVVISEYGIPSARSTGDFVTNTDKGYISEKEQAYALVTTYRAINEAGCAGSILFEWSDSWHRSAWNTKDRIILDKSAYWYDVQTYSQSFGLMAFEPNSGENIVYPDDNNDEWTKEDIMNQSEDLSLSMRSDAKYLYFMICLQDGFDPAIQEVFIDLDVTPQSGRTSSTEYNLIFDRPADFIIQINNKDNSKVLVHEYYNTYSFLEQEKSLRIRPDMIVHTPDMDRFSPIMLYIRPRTYVESLGQIFEREAIETGRLVHGNSNPYSDAYSSISDFYIGKDYIEVRIPWSLLNFMDPSTMQIHDDYYETFQIQPIKIDSLFAGVTVKEENHKILRLDAKPYQWKQWTLPTYHERLKLSYNLMKEELSKDSH